MSSQSWTSVCLALWLCAAGGALCVEDAAANAPAAQYRALVTEFNAMASGLRQAKTDEERNTLTARVEPLPMKILELVQNHPREPFALNALSEVIAQEYWLNTYTSHPGWGTESRQAKAIALLLRDHLQSIKLGDTCRRVLSGFRPECETFLRTVLEKSPHRDVQGVACLRLAQFLLSRLEKLELLKEQPELARRYELLYGKDYLDALRRQDPATVVKEADSLYERTIEKYGDVKIPYNDTFYGTVGETAKTELFEIRHLAVGTEAADIEGVDQDGRKLKLSDYRGKVVLLYFWSEY